MKSRHWVGEITSMKRPQDMHDLFAIGEVAEPEPVDRVPMSPTSSASSSHISRSIHSSGFDRKVHRLLRDSKLGNRGVPS